MKKIFILSRTNFFYFFSKLQLKKKYDVESFFLKYPDIEENRHKHYLSQYQELIKYSFYQRGIISDVNDTIITPELFNRILSKINGFCPDIILLEVFSYQEEDRKLIEEIQSQNKMLVIYDKEAKNFRSGNIKTINNFKEVSRI